MMDSDAPRPVGGGGSPHIPQDVDKKVDNAQESSEDAGPFNFTFYERRGKGGGAKGPKPPAPTLGAPVELNLSKEAVEKCVQPQNQDDNDSEKPENSGPPEEKDEKKPGDGHINITV